MPTNRKRPIFFLTILFFVVSIWFFSQGLGKRTDNSQKKNNTISNDIFDFKSDRKIFYALIEPNQTNLYRYTESVKETKRFYFDKDEEFKIIKALSMDNGNIIVFEGTTDETKKRLVQITTDQKANKKIINENFYTYNLPVISKNNKKIIYTSFSNVEKDYGFTIFSAELNGENKRQIYRTQNNIMSMGLSADNTLVISENSPSGGSMIKIYDFSQDKIENFYETENNLVEIAWKNSEIIFLQKTKPNSNENSPEMFSLDKNKNIKKISLKKTNLSNIFINNDEIYYIDKTNSTDATLSGAIQSIQKPMDKIIIASYIFGVE
ncbi:MAG: Uncharacterized protein CEN89_52 [Candidatus Berkelbacteria bacterium Licking1014_7]|uniref:Uncharacterized protein n=1 Tax=Candidatus Berkelbacteria bacterium Licking1014_7 TaxID=2017147 RepID=A0A554LKK2_9BACT|nr:MAG: Uncharacterized protein CEN89_52 [Candidatus Berkelbacteria bacterium Licking1014_7]